MTGTFLRITAILLLVVVLAGLFHVYGSVETDRYPGGSELASDYDAYLGERVQTSGTVVEEDPVVIEVESSLGHHRYSLENSPDVQTGQRITVYATVRSGYHLDVENAVVQDRWESWYLYTVSLLGVAIAVGLVARTWQFDLRRFQARPREGARRG